MKFTISADPVAQGRPRFFRRGRFVGTYDPPKSKEFKKRVAQEATKTGFFQGHGALRVVARFYLARPKRMKASLCGSDPVEHHKRPDLDNLLKGLFDGMKGVVYSDDSQVQEIKAQKFYHGVLESPRVEVEIVEV